MKRFAQNHQFYILVAFLLVMSSCVKEMDFDGVKDITLTPEMEIQLLKAEITQEEMVAIFEDRLSVSTPKPGYIPPIGAPPPSLGPIKKPISLTSEERILKYLVEGEDSKSGVPTPVLTFTFTNTINSEFDIEIYLRDKNEKILSEKEKNGIIIIGASVNGAEENVTKSFTYTPAQIRNATEIVIDFILTPKEDLYPDATRSLTINANGIFNFSYDTSEGLP